MSLAHSLAHHSLSEEVEAKLFPIEIPNISEKRGRQYKQGWQSVESKYRAVKKRILIPFLKQ